MPKERRPLTLQDRQARLAWLFLAPCVAVLLAIGLYPLLVTFQLSFTNTHAFTPADTQWAGTANFTRLLSESDFREALRNTIVFTVVSVSLEFFLGLGIALLIDSEFRARNFTRAAILIPWALPTVVAARLWGWMFNDVFGVFNDLFVERLGILSEPIAWTGTHGWAMASVIAVDVWKTTPFVALLLLAGLQVIPRGLYEAAQVDGAGPMRRFLFVTLPLLSPAILVALVFRTLDALRVFDVIWVMTQGSFGTETLGTYAYRQLFEYSRLGYGSAVCVVLFLLVALFVAGYVMVFRRWEGDR